MQRNCHCRYVAEYNKSAEEKCAGPMPIRPNLRLHCQKESIDRGTGSWRANLLRSTIFGNSWPEGDTISWKYLAISSLYRWRFFLNKYIIYQIINHNWLYNLNLRTRIKHSLSRVKINLIFSTIFQFFALLETNPFKWTMYIPKLIFLLNIHFVKNIHSSASFQLQKYTQKIICSIHLIPTIKHLIKMNNYRH